VLLAAESGCGEEAVDAALSGPALGWFESAVWPHKAAESARQLRRQDLSARLPKLFTIAFPNQFGRIEFADDSEVPIEDSLITYILKE
jgi:hypothetical protein